MRITEYKEKYTKELYGKLDDKIKNRTPNQEIKECVIQKNNFFFTFLLGSNFNRDYQISKSNEFFTLFN